MRHLKRICFFLYTGLLFAAGFYTHILFEAQFYPGREISAIFPVPKTVGTGQAVGQQAHSTDSLAVLQSDAVLTCDTQLVVQCLDLRTRLQTQQQLRLPERYIGMERDLFVRCIRDSMSAPLLAERQKGLASMEVLSFSPQKVVLLKCYSKKPPSASYYLAVCRNRVVVYEEDQRTVYLHTGIDARLLPDMLRAELLQGKTLSSKAELENFLVSYSGS